MAKHMLSVEPSLTPDRVRYALTTKRRNLKGQHGSTPTPKFRPLRLAAKGCLTDQQIVVN